MSQQQNLFPDSAPNCEPTYVPFVEDTRAAALAAIQPLKPNMQRQVFDFITSRGQLGATDEEVALALHMREGTARARRVELLHAGQVRDSLSRRKTNSGRNATIWQATGKQLD